MGLADALVKVASVAPWLAESEVFLEYLGFGEDDRKRLLSDKAKAQSQNLLAAALRQVAQVDNELSAMTEQPVDMEQ